MSKIMQKLEKMEIQITRVEEGVKRINGTIDRHEKEIVYNRNSISLLQKRGAYFAGALAVLFIILELSIKLI